ncbi:hypothetical protein [Candidatus Caldatribacterium sp.]|uniref:hypothetical protein n=1 Tax=Candidatus Caldatribacterium sp. TaxID=2282143 RepID=UPI00383CA304|nr:hypothetical protein [Candidatus Caldatribacterium sp.]
MSLKPIRTGGIAIPFQYHRQLTDHPDQFIEERGVTVIWQKCLFCPCLNEYGQPDPYCSTCHGRGFFHHESWEIKALFTDVQGVPQYLRPGFWLWGTAYLTTKSTVKLAFRDRIIVPKYDSVYLETRQVTSGMVTFPLRQPRTIEFVTYRDQHGRVTIVPPDAYQYQNGVLSFTDPPEDGTVVTVRYQAPLMYMVVNLLHEARGWRDHQGREVMFPNQYLVQREDLVTEEKQNT